MKNIYNNIWIGNEEDCLNKPERIVTVHACKYPCYNSIMGHATPVPKHHPNYLSKEIGFDLYLNMIDPRKPIFERKIFEEPLYFLQRFEMVNIPILIHCNKGESRAPSLALLYLANTTDLLNKNHFEGAQKDFMKIYPNYKPGGGISAYLAGNWDELINVL